METIKDILSWWYGDPAETFPNGVICSFWLCLTVSVIGGIIVAWKSTDKSEIICLPILIALVTGIGGLLIGLLFPLILVCGILILFLLFISKWGNKCRELEKSKETRRAEALATLLKNDPELLDRYNEMMKESEKLMDL